jgi:hypothetical protein
MHYAPRVPRPFVLGDVTLDPGSVARAGVQSQADDVSIQEAFRGLRMNSTPTIDEIRDHVSRVAFGSPLVQNNPRALVVEAIIDCALRPSWNWVSKDWAGWDFEHAESGVRLEVKQSSARQTWTAPFQPTSPRFDIRARTGYWDDGATWVDQAGRLAQIYVFAHHPIRDDTADLDGLRTGAASFRREPGAQLTSTYVVAQRDRLSNSV